jgi:hypothetical protein
MEISYAVRERSDIPRLLAITKGGRPAKAVIYFLKGSSMQKNQMSKAMMSNTKTEPAVLLHRVGSTIFRVNVHFSRSGKETMEDKVLRIIEREVSNIA